MRDRSREAKRYKTDDAYAERRREANRRYKAKMRSLSSYRMAENSKKRLDRGNPSLFTKNCKGVPKKYKRFLANPQDYQKIHNYGITGEIEIHHIHEFYPDGTVRWTVKQMIEMGIYYNRDACELVILPKDVHKRLHKLDTPEKRLELMKEYNIFIEVK